MKMIFVAGLVCLLAGCSTIGPAPRGTETTLVPTSDFTMRLPPFVSIEVFRGQQVSVIGSTERGGKSYRVAVLPAPAAGALRFLLNDDGTFEGSAINFMGERMGFSYKPNPPDVRLVPVVRGPFLSHAEPPLPDKAEAPEPPRPSLESSAPGDGAELSDDQWGEVRCDLVAQENREPCMAAHARLSIASDRTTAAGSFSPEAAAEAPRQMNCFAGDGYRPIVDMQDVDPGAYECDLVECQAYASQINPVRSAVTNAAAGAIFGALFGLAVGDHGWAARAGAQGGAIGGAMSGAAGAGAAQVNIVRNCMAGRGYRVLQ